MTKTIEGYVVAVETPDGSMRYMTEEFGIVRAKSDARVHETLDSATGQCSTFQRMFPGKAFSVELAETAELAFRKENGY